MDRYIQRGSTTQSGVGVRVIFTNAPNSKLQFCTQFDMCGENTEAMHNCGLRFIMGTKIRLASLNQSKIVRYRTSAHVRQWNALSYYNKWKTKGLGVVPKEILQRLSRMHSSLKANSGDQLFRNLNIHFYRGAHWGNVLVNVLYKLYTDKIGERLRPVLFSSRDNNTHWTSAPGGVVNYVKWLIEHDYTVLESPLFHNVGHGDDDWSWCRVWMLVTTEACLYGEGKEWNRKETSIPDTIASVHGYDPEEYHLEYAENAAVSTQRETTFKDLMKNVDR